MKKFLKIDDLSEYLGIKKSTLYAKASRGEIPHYKIGSLIRFNRTEIDLWMEGFRQTTVDMEKRVRKVTKRLKNDRLEIDSVIKKAIEDTR